MWSWCKVRVTPAEGNGLIPRIILPLKSGQIGQSSLKLIWINFVFLNALGFTTPTIFLVCTLFEMQRIVVPAHLKGIRLGKSALVQCQFCVHCTTLFPQSIYVGKYTNSLHFSPPYYKKRHTYTQYCCSEKKGLQILPYRVAEINAIAQVPEICSL